jgi:hypothetical protein
LKERRRCVSYLYYLITLITISRGCYLCLVTGKYTSRSTSPWMQSVAVAAFALTAAIIPCCRWKVCVSVTLPHCKFERITAYNQICLNHLRRNNLKTIVLICQWLSPKHFVCISCLHCAGWFSSSLHPLRFQYPNNVSCRA